MISRSFQTKLAGVTFATCAALLLSGCGGGDSGSTASDGSLTLRVTDAPVDDLCEVWVTFSEVHLVPGDEGGLIRFDESNTDSLPASIELTSLDQGISVALLNGEPLPAGDYNQIRLVIDDSSDTYVIKENEIRGCEELPTPLFCPSCTQSGLKLNLDEFTLEADGLVDFTIDFDLEKSIILPPGRGYLLKPTHTVIETAVASTQFTGTVTDSQSTPGNPVEPTECAVYVYQGDVQPDDNCSNDIDTSACDGIRAQSYRSAAVVGSGSPYTYHTGYMNVGSYTVTLACGDDDPEADDDLTFIGTTVVDAIAGLNEVDFTLTD